MLCDDYTMAELKELRDERDRYKDALRRMPVPNVRTYDHQHDECMGCNQLYRRVGGGITQPDIRASENHPDGCPVRAALEATK